MELKVKSRSGKDLAVIGLSGDSTVLELKKAFHKEHAKYYPDRQWFTVGDKKGPALKDPTKTLNFYEVKSGDTLVFKDLGPQVSW